MNDIYFYCAIDSQNKNDGTRCDWYLIGASSKDLKTMDHEIAHGLYFTNKNYKKEVTKLIDKIKSSHYEKLKKKLIKMGYVDDKKIIDDEIQAFMSTGLYNGLNTNELKVYEKEFKKNFKKFTNV
jgi:predicted unusual protein kinase regulating ubiquinone biosynthesis (AarF/ABC1/UbiB family)